MEIFKFGGTSVGSTNAIKQTIDIISEQWKKNSSLVVVTSALSQVTNLLILVGEKAENGDNTFKDELAIIKQKHIDIINDLLNEKEHKIAKNLLEKRISNLNDLVRGIYVLKDLSHKTKACLIGFGEILSVSILTSILKQKGIKAVEVDTRLLLITDDKFLNAKIYHKESYQNVKKAIGKFSGQLPVVTGFISSNKQGITTTLGRGGSDYTASLFGAALNAKRITIWTDVNGMLTANPKIVKNAHSLTQLSYQEAMELSNFGAKVIYPPALSPAFTMNIPILIKNTFEPKKKGTLITKKGVKSNALIKGISTIDDICLITISGSVFIGVPGVASKLFSSLANHGINILLITQSSSEHSLCIGLTPEDTDLAVNMLNDIFETELLKGFVDPLLIEKDKSVLAIIGENMKSLSGLSAKFFVPLGNNGINISAIAQGASEMNISVVIDNKDLHKATNLIHQVFFYEEIKRLNIFLCGVGLIGSTLIKQIKEQTKYLIQEKGLEIKIVGVSNSKKMLFNKEGISPNEAIVLLKKEGLSSSIDLFTQQMYQLNLSNSIFIDCTSNEEVTHCYEQILNQTISIVTPNKLANSGNMQQYQKLQNTAFTQGVRFLYETNVGAGLPIISTLNDLKDSGDKFFEIEGVLSGTISYIFNTFDENTNFHKAVEMAQKEGLTEPDPREDLKGKDIARKILILAREAGFHIEPYQVKIQSILPQKCIEAPSIDEFFETLKEETQYFDNIRKSAQEKGEVLRFIAKVNENGVSVTLQSVGKEHPFYNLSGSDNIISFKTRRYFDRPLVIKGPGAGAEVTAAGVFAEIISISKPLFQGMKNEKPVGIH